MNNGPMKGGIASYLDVVKKAPGIVDLWQLHKSLVAGDSHNTSEQFIANLEPEDQCNGHWLKGTRIAVGVNNITDNDPPLIASSFEDNTDKSTYDIIGRFVYFEIAKKF